MNIATCPVVEEEEEQQQQVALSPAIEPQTTLARLNTDGGGALLVAVVEDDDDKDAEPIAEDERREENTFKPLVLAEDRIAAAFAEATTATALSTIGASETADLRPAETLLEPLVATSVDSSSTFEEYPSQIGELSSSLTPHFEAFSDAELVAALQSLGIDDDDDDCDALAAASPPEKHQQHNNDYYYYGQTLDFPCSSEDLPELEFNGDDDPLLLSYQHDLENDDDHNNLLGVFDENHHQDEPIDLDIDPASDILQQLELLTLFNEQNDEDEGHWMQPFQEPNPQGTTPSNLHRAESPTVMAGAPWLGFSFPESSTRDDDNDNEKSEEEGPLIYYCQPCNSPSSVPPPVAALPQYSSYYYSEEQAWALAAAAVLAEQLGTDDGAEDRAEHEAFWREQIRLLTTGGLAVPSAAAAAAAGNQQHPPPKSYPQPDPFELLHLDEHDGSMTLDDDAEPIPIAAAAAEDSTTLSGHVHEEDEPTKRRSLRPEALRAAQPFVTAFGTSLTVDNSAVEPKKQSSAKGLSSSSSTRTPQRACLGHRERVLGCDFSSCGKYVATASQDSTVRVWSTATHRELAVVRGHSKEHECLRVAWASPAWAQDQIQRCHRRRTAVKGEEPTTQAYAYLLATGGADGVVHLWGCDNPETGTWTNYATLDHSTYSHVKERSPKAPSGLEKVEEAEDEEADEDESEIGVDSPQIYSLQFIDHWEAFPSRSMSIGDDVGCDDQEKASNRNNSFLLTSSDDHVHLWEIDESNLNKKSKAADGAVSKQLQLREVFSLRFGTLDGPAYGVTISPVTERCMLTQGELQQHSQHDNMCPNNASNKFGGDRNPDNVVFVFDASYCPANGLLGAALSDGSLRLMNGRGVCLSVLQLPGCQSHLTSFSWDSKGERLATTVATGHLITWGIDLINTLGAHGPNYHHSLVSEGIRASCRSVMEGGHARGRPLYGTRYLENDDLLISWGGDGRVCLWDSRSCDEEIDEPLAVLWDNNNDKTGDGYPVYALSVTKKTAVGSNSSDKIDPNESTNNSMLSIAIAGGGTTGGFLGIPVYLQDVYHLPDDEVDAVQEDAKRPKHDGS